MYEKRRMCQKKLHRNLYEKIQQCCHFKWGFTISTGKIIRTNLLIVCIYNKKLKLKQNALVFYGSLLRSSPSYMSEFMLISFSEQATLFPYSLTGTWMLSGRTFK